jgi:hypothetical protein
MLDLFYLLLVGGALGWFGYLGWRVIIVLETLAGRLGDALAMWEHDGWRQKIQPAPWLPGPTAGTTSQERQEIKAQVRVPDLSPEVIAPHIKHPPKSAGFGSVVGGRNDGDP